MTVGRDYSFAYFDTNTSQVIDLGDIQQISVRANKHAIKSMPYNGPPRFGYIPDGYSFSGTIVRTGAEIEEFQLSQAAAFDAGRTILAGYLNETVNNDDGSVSRYQYKGFVLWFDDLGTISRDATVQIRFEGMASYKTKIA